MTEDFTPFDYQPAMIDHLIDNERAALSQLLPCPFCGYEFDHDGLGRFGCPNCHGEGLDDAEQMRLQPGRRRTSAILPLVSGGTRATQGGNDLRGGMVGKLVNEGHGQTVAPKNKSAMRKIILAKRPQCGQIVRVSQPHHKMKTATITKLSETTFAVSTDLFMSNCTNWAGDMQLKDDTLVRIPGVIYNYCPKISLPNHADQLRGLAVGEAITIG